VAHSRQPLLGSSASGAGGMRLWVNRSEAGLPRSAAAH
jgi:hypothetical protein